MKKSRFSTGYPLGKNDRINGEGKFSIRREDTKLMLQTVARGYPPHSIR